MRNSEITPELIELSRRAKELGFPQDVEEGDWVVEDEYSQNIYCLRSPTVYPDGSIDDEYDNCDIRFKARADHWFLTLSFSRCLEWLQERLNVPFDDINYASLVAGLYLKRNIHEAGAKAVVKILEEK